jgi:NADH-quinone oxidoreductase subunit I
VGNIQVKVVARPASFEQDMYFSAVVKGLGVTMRHFFENLFQGKSIVTVQYPEEIQPYPKRNRGLHHLTKREDGSVRCVACMCCPTACPAHCITIVAEETGNPDEKRPLIFEIDELRCVVCGLCVEACPCDAIRMDTGTHAAPVERRADAVLGKLDLMQLTKTVSAAHQGGLGGEWREQQPPIRTDHPQSPQGTPGATATSEGMHQVTHAQAVAAAGGHSSHH